MEIKNRHKYLLQYHIIFVCKYRKKLLVSKQISDDIKQFSYEICQRHKVIYFACSVGNVSEEILKKYIKVAKSGKLLYTCGMGTRKSKNRHKEGGSKC